MNQENQDFIPENNGNQSQNSASDGQSDIQAKLQVLLEKFKSFPPKIQVSIIGGAALLFYIVFVKGGGDVPVKPPVPVQPVAQKQENYNPGTTTARSINRKEEDDESFSLVNSERESLQRGFFEKERRLIDKRLGGVEEKVEERMNEVKEIQQSIAKQAKQLSQMVENFHDEMKSMEKLNKGSLEEIRKLAEESKNRNIQAPGSQGGSQMQGGGNQRGGSQSPQSGRNKPIKQIILQQESSNNTLGDPLLGGLVNPGQQSVQTIQEQIEMEVAEAAPFVPPLGFVRGTLINGFDALAGAGALTPALVRLSGTYKTAMNSTVNLNGCFMLIEFEGDLSTERAFGKPATMTCVYPDQGAINYDSLQGYVVDEKDGIVGIPGIFYEGDPTRLAAAMVADFTAAIADIVKSNQSTSTSSSEGVEQSTLTGSETKAEIAGGISTAVGSLRDYLAERANRIVPFIRVDATRELHIVLLSAVELRHQGKPWTLLVSGDSQDKIAVQRERNLQQLRKAQQTSNTRR